MRSHEDIVVFYKKQPTYNPQFTSGKPYDKGKALRDATQYGKQTKSVHVKDTEGKRYPRSVLYFKTAEDEGKLHPTQKPIALYEYLIRTYSNEGETVLDFTMGSGSTGVACLNLNRNFFFCKPYPCLVAEEKSTFLGCVPGIKILCLPDTSNRSLICCKTRFNWVPLKFELSSYRPNGEYRESIRRIFKHFSILFKCSC